MKQEKWDLNDFIKDHNIYKYTDLGLNMKNMKKLQVADFFCGAGGFSEGFRQMGLNPIFALDNWQPAVDTHHLNHPNCNTIKKDILELDTPEKIDSVVPDTEIFIGSPPCVAFSNSNRSGKAEKSKGIQLIEAYLRIIAWKKQKGSLKYWILENVPNAGEYIKEKYTWKELGLPGTGPDLTMQQRNILNSADYGAPQKRKRFVCGDYPLPKQTLREDKWVSIKKVITALSNPLLNKTTDRTTDPNYGFTIKSTNLTDHFYDTRIAKFEWKKAKRLKEDHGYMGKMSFPENIEKPSRTIMATRSASTREAMIFSSVDKNGKHKGYRLPTLREVACLMSFPITYQFEAGSEGSKQRLAGNAVCPKLSTAIAKGILEKERLPKSRGFIPLPKMHLSFDLTGTKRKIKRPKPRKADAKFSRHIPYMKIRGFRVELTNLDSDFRRNRFKWSCILHQGSGKDALKCDSKECKLNKIIKELPRSDEFQKAVYKIFKESRLTHHQLQEAYVQNGNSRIPGPEFRLNNMKKLVDTYFVDDNLMIENKRLVNIERKVVPVRILAGLYVCNYFVKNLG